MRGHSTDGATARDPAAPAGRTGTSYAAGVSERSDDPDLDIHIGHDELVLRQRYEVLSIANDVLIGVWFLIGSFLFFQESTATAGTWLFVVGSAQLLIRPMIRLSRRVHLVRSGTASAGNSEDF